MQHLSAIKMAAVVVLVLTFVAASTWYAQAKRPLYYRGLEPLGSEVEFKEESGEVVFPEDEKDTLDFSKITASNSRRINNLTPRENTQLQTSTLTLEPVASPCKIGEIPIIKTGKFVSCNKNEKKAPVIVIIN